jgi:putative transposase
LGSEGGSWVTMPDGLKRYYGKQDLHFVTFSCYGRLPLLGRPSARDIFVRELERIRAERGFRLIGYVVMPEHVHLLLSEPERGTPSTVVQVPKQRVSRKLRRGEDAQEPGRFWQRRFYDFNVYSSGKLREKVHYMHANPVIRRLVEHPRDWPWSSWSNYANNGEGLVEVDLM